MKMIRKLFILSACIAVLLMHTAVSPIDEPYNYYVPVIVKRADLEKSIAMESPRVLSRPGKIYIYKNYLMVNEKYKGIHIFNNANPSSPVNLGFLQIPGNVDLAVKDDILYANSATDLVAIRISDFGNIQVTSRNRKTLPEISPPDDLYVPWQYARENRPEDTEIIDWKPRDNQ